MSMKAQKMVSKRLNMYEENKDDQKPTIWSNAVAKGLSFADEDIEMDTEPIACLNNLPHELQSMLVQYLPV